jgi:hypothetical protein
MGGIYANNLKLQSLEDPPNFTCLSFTPNWGIKEASTKHIYHITVDSDIIVQIYKFNLESWVFVFPFFNLLNLGLTNFRSFEAQIRISFLL